MPRLGLIQEGGVYITNLKDWVLTPKFDNRKQGHPQQVDEYVRLPLGGGMDVVDIRRVPLRL